MHAIFQYKFIHKFKWLSAILILVVLLTACANPESPIIGKWEVVSGTTISSFGVSNTTTGSLYEFFPDGTVSVNSAVGKYSLPDQTHMKMAWEWGGSIYTYNLSGDELTLTDTYSLQALVLKKYKEFNLSPQVVAGTWECSNPDTSSCFNGLGIGGSPHEMILGTDGRFAINGNANSNWLIGFGPSMNGQYTTSGNILHVTASGTQKDFSGTTIHVTHVQGGFDCAVTISNSRLTFQDAQGRSTVFVRAGK